MGTAVGAAALWAVAGSPASAQVSGGTVAAGSAQISGAGTSNVLVTQSSKKAVVDWRSFSVAAGDSVRFAQPDRGSVTLNRVTGSMGSRIDGSLSANGQVWLLNPNGVIVGAGGRIAAGGFLATTHALSNDDFMSGRYDFGDAAAAGASVINAGRIEGSEGGYVVLAGREVANHGLIEARLGTVALGAARRFTLDLAGDRLLSFAVEGELEALPASGAAAVTNRGLLRADGGRVVMTARAAADVVEQVINTSGLVQAQSVKLVDGQVVLDGGAAGLVQASGKLDVSGKDSGESGGRLHVLGDTIIVGDGARLDARGDAGGGAILVGGGWQGERVDGHASAVRVAVAPSATLDASAIASGNGGMVVAWSDVTNAASRTYALGSFRADGGATGGDGGRIETSGHDLITTGVRGSAAAPNGKAGTWLFDPYDIEIVAGNSVSLVNPGFENGLTGWTSFGTGGAVETTTSAPSILDGDFTAQEDLHFLLATAGNGNIKVGVEQPFDGLAGQKISVFGVFIGQDSFPDSSAIELVGPNGVYTLYSRGVADTGAFNAGPWQQSSPFTLPTDGRYIVRASVVNHGDRADSSQLGFEVATAGFGGLFSTQSTGQLWTANSSSSKVYVEKINALLSAGTNVHISTAGPGTQAGDITVNADILKSGSTTAALKLEADRSIIVNNSISSSDGRLDVELLAKGGSITVLSPIDVSPAVGLAGNITLTAIRSGTGPSATGGLIDIQEGATLRGDHVAMNADRTSVGAPVSAKNSITVAPTTVNRTIRLEPNAGSGDVLSLGHAALANLQAPTLTIGHAAGTGRIEIDPGLQSLPGSELARQIVIRSPGTGGRIEIRSNQLDVATNERWRFIAGDEILLGTSARLDIAGTLELVAGQRFTNQSGADALSTQGGRWLIYSAAPALDIFDGLASGQAALWGRSLADASAGNIVATGNRYAFGLAPVLTVTAKNRSKTYGNVASFGASDYTVSGLISAAQFGNVFAQDQLGGTLSLTSDGAAERANVGTYGISVANQALSVPQGYSVQVQGGTLTVDPKAIGASLVGTVQKTYDGNSSATLGASNYALSGVLSGDDVGVSTTAGSYDNRNAGTGKTVTVASLQLTGASAGNYTTSGPASGAVGRIDAKAITGTAAVANKVYDGTTAATGTLTLAGTIAGDDIGTTGATFAFADGNAGTAKAVNTVGAALTGSDAGNYTLTIGPATADIAQKAIGSIVTAASKTYDRTTVATGSVSLTGVILNDSVGLTNGNFTFADRNAGMGKTVNVSGFGLTGADAGNYALSLPTTTTADIFQKMLIGTVVADSRTYDGTTSATGGVTLAGVIEGDAVGASASLAFADKNAGFGKTVTASELVLTGEDAGNYSLAAPMATLADIFTKPIEAIVAAASKTYDGSTATTGTITLQGIIGGDAVTADASFAFLDKNVGFDKTVNVTAMLAGADAGNYTLTIGPAVADITPKTIGGVLTAASKSYDGGTTTTGSVSLAGVVSGDFVEASGGNFEFADRNAGTGKTVNVANIGLTGADAANYTLSLPDTVIADIFQKELTVSLLADSKTYDGGVAATGTLNLAGAIAGDDVGVTSASLAFADRNAGTAKTVTATGAALTGAHAGNYSVTGPVTGVASIFQKALGATAFANGKIYDGTIAATGLVTITGTVVGDSVTTTAATFAFSDKNAGTAKTVNIANVALAGADAGNYSLVAPTTTLADITPKAITASVSAQGKTYDGTTAATGTVALNGTIAGDLVAPTGAQFAFADRNAGTAKTVNVSGVTLAGADAGNYALSAPATTVADILKKLLAANATAASKTYDGTTAATGQLALSGVVAGDAVTTAGTQFAFADRNAGTGKLVNISGATLTGSDAGNYSLDAPATTFADILRKLVDVQATAAGKVYDGTKDTTGTVALTGLVTGDIVNTAAAQFAFADPDAGTGKIVGLTGLTLVARDAGNYVLGALPTITADITPKSLTAALTGSVQKVYDATTAATLSAANYSLAGFVAGEGASIGQTSGSFASPGVGSNLVVTASLGPTSFAANGGTSLSNYLLPTSASGAIGTITPATLTYVANPAERPRGNPDPALTGNVTGFVGPDTQATATSGALAFATNASINSPVGAYAINGAGLTAGNYVFTQAPANAAAFRVTEAMSTASSVSVVVQSATVAPPPTPTPTPTPAPTPAAAPTAAATAAASTANAPAAPGSANTAPAAPLVIAPPPPPPPPAPLVVAPPLTTSGATGVAAVEGPPPPPPPGRPVEATPPSPVGEAAAPTPNDAADQGDTVLTEAAAPEEEQEEATSEKRQVASTTTVVPGVNIEVPRPPRPPEVPGADQAFSGSGNPAQW